MTGAIIASLLFFVLVFAAQRSGLAPEVKQRDRVAVGTLVEDPDYEHGRPHRFLLRLEDGRLVGPTEDPGVPRLDPALRPREALA